MGDAPGRSDETRTSAHDDAEAIAAARPGGRGADSPYPERIPGYRVLGPLGEGGMGIVLEAEQESPRRRVALKLIRGGAFASASARAMFRREVELLSRLEHPNIAAVHDAGSTDDGQPFLVMELVTGLRFDRYIGEQRPRLDRRELEFRIRLFQRICTAVQHAHQRGVIHRDLKPANLIVSSEVENADGIPLVKILDFGLARLTEDEAEATRATQTGTVKGTLAYMSPEQARGIPSEVDTRTDVYALGVILYEMLTGKRPHLIEGRSFLEAARTITDEQPRSLRAAWDVRALRLDDDLETIVRTALDPDRDRRYATADALARDLGRYLRREPIEAQPPSATYHWRKFAERNRILVGGILATGIVLAAGIVVSTIFGTREAAQRRLAEQARQTLEEVVEFQNRMLADVDPEQTGIKLQETLARDLGPTDMARRVIDENILVPAAAAATRQFADRPLIEARLQHTLAETRTELGLYVEAEAGFRRAAELRAAVLGERAAETLASRNEIAGALHRQGRFEEAVALVDTLIEQQREELPEDDPRVLSLRQTRASSWVGLGDYERALSELDSVLAQQKRRLGETDPAVATTLSVIGAAYLRRGLHDQAGTAFQEVLERRRRLDGPDAPETLSAMLNLASVRTNQRRYEEAERLFVDAGESLARRLGAEHPRTLRNTNNLAHLYGKMGRLDEAYALEVETLRVRERVLGPTHPETLRSLNNLAYRLITLGRLDEAESTLATLLARDEATHPGSPDHAVHLHTRAEVLAAGRRWDEVSSTLARVLEIYRRSGHANLGEALVLAARAEARLGRVSGALDRLREARAAGYLRPLGEGDPDFGTLAANPAYHDLARGETPAATE